MRRIALIAPLVLALVAQGLAVERVIGKLGQTVKPTKIYASPNSKSRVQYRPKAYEYLIVRKSKFGAWLQVVMENYRVCYIPSDAVAQLPYDVTQAQQQTSRAGTPTRASNYAGALGQYALQYVGTPYKWGGNDVNHGIDCSGFVKNIFGTIGVNLPRTAAQQALVGQEITRLEDLRPNDRLYFWDAKRGKIGHTGMYLGNGFFVHSSSSRGGVATDDLRNPKWRKILVSARR